MNKKERRRKKKCSSVGFRVATCAAVAAAATETFSSCTDRGLDHVTKAFVRCLFSNAALYGVLIDLFVGENLRLRCSLIWALFWENWTYFHRWWLFPHAMRCDGVALCNAKFLLDDLLFCGVLHIKILIILALSHAINALVAQLWYSSNFKLT